MKSSRKKPQLRACTFCQKPGHNKSTCPKFLASLRPRKAATAPVRFFVHHVSHNEEQSPHVIDLKTPADNVWDKIKTFAPEEIKSADYFFYHQQKQPASETKLFDKPLASIHEICARPEPVAIIKKDLPPQIKAPKIKTHFQLPSLDFYSLRQNTIRKFQEAFPLKRLAIITASIALLLTVPTHASSYYHNLKTTTEKIAGNSTAGFMALQESTAAIFNADFDTAQTKINTALLKLNTAVATMQNNHQLLQKIVGDLPILSPEVKSRQNLITAGQSIALGNNYLLRGLTEVKNNPSSTLTDTISSVSGYLRAAIPSYESALTDLSTVDASVLPYEYQSSFNDFKVLFATILSDLRNLSDLGQAFVEIFGGQGQRRYLIVFQNSYELRPTGGFVGSFAVIDVKDGKIVKINIPAGGSYSLKGQLNETIEPPSPLLLTSKRWEFQDANWFPDFPASAEKMLWFYRKSRDVTADGVIAINGSVLERLLSITGPITDSKRQITISADNALPTIQNIVEFGAEKANKKPKQIIADLAPQFLEYFKNLKTTDALPLLINLQEALSQKEIQACFTDAQTQNSIQSFGWGGQILDTNANQDYLMVVNTNIQGQKSDAKIKQTISHQTEVQPDGSIVDSVVITRKHTGSADEQLYGSHNINYLRIYVPEGSELIAASGFTWPDEANFRAPEAWAKKDPLLAQLEKEISIDPGSGTRITSEFGKTAFGNWTITEPSAESEVQFVYRLPFKANLSDNQPRASWKKLLSNDRPLSNYQLVVQRQSGSDSDFESQIIYPTGWHPAWKDGDDIKLADNGATITNQPLNQDSIWSLIFKSE